MPQPALDPGTQSETVSIRVPKAVKAAYRARAKASGVTLSEWVRVTLDSGGVVAKTKGSVTALPAAPKKPAHEHEQVAARPHGGVDILVCKCGAIHVNGRWV